MAAGWRGRAGALAVAVLAGCLPACLSPVPLDPTPQADLDPRLVGTWRCVSGEMDDDDEHLNLKIARVPDRDRVFAIEMGEPGEESERYEAHASLVEGRTIVNVRDVDLKPTAKPWDFAEYDLLRPGLLVIRLNDFDAFEGVDLTPAALRKRIAEAGAFTDFCVCVRHKKKD